jgi:hypothetical protein
VKCGLVVTQKKETIDELRLFALKTTSWYSIVVGLSLAVRERLHS